MAWGRGMFVQNQDSVKKELIRGFPSKDFSWIDNMFPDEDEDEEEEEEEDNRVSIDTIVDVKNNVIETQERLKMPSHVIFP